MTVNEHESVARYRRYAQHIGELAKAFKVRLCVRRHMTPDAAYAGLATFTGQPAIVIAPVIDESTYAVALHELGHNLHPLGRVHKTEGSELMRRANKFDTTRDVWLKLLSEESAWEWAHHYALEWTPLMTQIETDALASYRAVARKLGVKS